MLVIKIFFFFLGGILDFQSIKIIYIFDEYLNGTKFCESV